MVNQRARSLAITFFGLLVSIFFTLGLSGCTPERIEISPKTDVNPPGTQHEITAKVTDSKGRPVSHTLVEWMLPRSEHTVGDIIEGGDDPAKTYPIPKKTNTYAKTRTNLDGEAKITITSPLKGKTSIIAMAKGIEDKTKHKAFAVKYWSYINWYFPNDETNLAGTPHHMTVQVHKPYTEQDSIRFKITKTSLNVLQDKGLPVAISEKLQVLKREEAKIQKRFLEMLTHTIGASPVTQYKALILKHTEYVPRDDDLRNYRVEWEILSKFQVTEQSIDQLRQEDIPDDILRSLNRIVKHAAITGKREFLAFVAETIGREPTYTHQTSILRATRIRIGPEAYFESNGTDLVTTETMSQGFTAVTLHQVLPKRGTNRIRVRLMLPNKQPDGLDQLCCPKPNDVIAEHIVKKTWVPPEIPILKCGIDGYQKVALGDTATFDISFTNQSDFTITSIVVTDKLPPGFTFVSALPRAPALIQQPEVGEIDGTVIWALQKLPARQSATLQIRAKAEYVGRFKNTVRLTTPHSTKYFDASCTIDVVAPELKVWKFCPPMAAVNQPFPYSYVVKNPGTETVTDIVVRDELPPGVIAESGKLEWRFGALAPGNTIEESFNAIPQASLLPGGAAYGGYCKVNGKWVQGHSVTNTITASAPWISEQSDTLSSEEQCNTCVRPEPYPALLLEVVDLYDTVNIGDTTTYKITVTNQDRADVKNINVAIWIPGAYYSPEYGTNEVTAALDELIKPMVSSQPKVRLLRSIQEPSPDKQPLVVRPLEAFPENMLDQMLTEMLWNMMWTVLRSELSKTHKAPEAFRQKVLHDRLESKIEALKQKLLQKMRSNKNDPPQPLLDVDRKEQVNKLHDLLQQEVRVLLQEMENIQEWKPEEELPPFAPSDKLKPKLRSTIQMMWPGNEPEVWDPYTSDSDRGDRQYKKRWITFQTIPLLKQYWRATYYVQVQAVEADDVRFKVIMSADEFRGPVIETESTHLID